MGRPRRAPPLFVTPPARALFCDPVSHESLRQGSAALCAHLLELAKQRALRDEQASIIADDFDAVWVAPSRKRAWLARQGVIDFMPGHAVRLQPSDPA